MRVVTLAGDSELEPAIAAQLGERRDVELVLRCLDRVELLAAIRGGDLDAIVSVGAPDWLDARCVAEAADRSTTLVALAEDDWERERLAGRAGAVLSKDASIDEIVERCSAPGGPPARGAYSSQPSVPRGELIAVWGPKGAPGRTTVAIELAAELAACDRDTLLVDGDPYGGDVVQLLGVVDELPTIVWASQMAAKEELDAARLSLDLRRAGRNGPVLLPGLVRAELWAEISEFGWRQLLTVALASFAYSVCDIGFCLEASRAVVAAAGEGRNMIARTTVAEAHRVVAVCRADPVGIKSFLWAAEELRRLVDLDRVLVVANRVHPSEQQDVAEVLRKHLGKRPIAYIPDRPSDLVKAVRAGMAVRDNTPGSDIAPAVRSLAAAMGARVGARGLLTRLAGRA